MKLKPRKHFSNSAYGSYSYYVALPANIVDLLSWRAGLCVEWIFNVKRDLILRKVDVPTSRLRHYTIKDFGNKKKGERAYYVAIPLQIYRAMQWSESTLFDWRLERGKTLKLVVVKKFQKD